MKAKRLDVLIIAAAVGAMGLLVSRSQGQVTITDLGSRSEAARRVGRLRAAAELPVRHAYYVFDDNSFFARDNHAAAVEVARITGSVSVSLDHPETFAAACALLAEAPRARLCVMYSPWAAIEGGPCDDWRAHIMELARVGAWLEALPAEPWAVVLDHERYSLTGDSAIDACVAEKLTAIDRTVREICPNAKVVWYGAPNAHGQGAVGPPVDYYAPSLYKPQSLVACQERYNAAWRESILADALGGERRRIVPFVSLGSGYDDAGKWSMSLDYPADCDRELGAWLASYPHDLGFVVLYPEAPHVSRARVKNWYEHFDAYCAGWKGGG